MTVSDLSPQDFIRIIGEERERQSPDTIATAEKRLRELIVAYSEDTVRRIHRFGRIIAGLGLVLGIWPCLIIPIFFAVLLAHGTPFRDATLLDWLGLSISTALPILLAIYGFLMFRAGRHFRERKDWARKRLIQLLWVAIGYFVAFASFAVSMTLLLSKGRDSAALLFALLCVLISGCLSLLVWQAKQYFSSPTTVWFCSPTGDIQQLADGLRREMR